MDPWAQVPDVDLRRSHRPWVSGGMNGIVWRYEMNEEEVNAGKLMEIAGAYWPSFTLHAGVRLDLFTLLDEERLTGEEMAHRLGGDVRGVTTLLNALTAMGLLTKAGGIFANTPLSSRFLSKNSPDYAGYMILHLYHLVESWHRLDEAVLAGKPTRAKASIRGEEEREAFLMGMFNVAMGLASGGVKEIDLAGRWHLLDMGGGPGTWAIHFCLANPGLKATVLDLPETRPFAEKTVARFGVGDRVLFRAGDYLNEEIPGSYDVAWLSQILHGEGPDACVSIIRKAAKALVPGGLILVHDFILDNDMTGPLQSALFSLNMLAVTEGGRSYSEAQIMNMLREAGARDIRRLPFRSPLETGIVAGTL
jgi:SAM-dependent methyltransferase